MKRLNHTGDDGDSTGARLVSTSYRATIRGRDRAVCRLRVRLQITCWFGVFLLRLNARKKPTNRLEQRRRDQTRIGFDERSEDDSLRTFPQQPYNPYNNNVLSRCFALNLNALHKVIFPQVVCVAFIFFFFLQ